MLEVVLARAAGVTPWKRTLMIPLSRVDAGVSGQMAARGESLGTYVTHVLFFICRRGGDRTRMRMMVEIWGVLEEMAFWMGRKIVGRVRS